MFAAKGGGAGRPTEVSEQKTKPDRSRATKTGHLDELRTERSPTLPKVWNKSKCGSGEAKVS